MTSTLRKRTHPMRKTGQMMRHKTDQIFVMSSRPIPTQRRYSIDADIPGAGDSTFEAYNPYTYHQIRTDTTQTQPPTLQTDPPTGRLITQRLPDMRRHMVDEEGTWYHMFTDPVILQPPCDDQIYLELGTATIRNNSLYYMMDTDGEEAWMRDESLDMAMEVLQRGLKCDQHAIGFASSTDAQVIHAANANNETHETAHDVYRTRFEGKRWIFIPMNNAIGSQVDGGVHWSLIALDRVHKSAHYFDSLFIEYSQQRWLFKSITWGLLAILGEDTRLWRMVFEENSPSQVKHNLCKDDAGPCAPFVYKMTEFLAAGIIRAQEDNKESEYGLCLSKKFAKQFFLPQFDSKQVRCMMQRSIIDCKLIMFQNYCKKVYDDAVLQEILEGENIEVVDASYGDPQKPLTPEHSRTRPQNPRQCSLSGSISPGERKRTFQMATMSTDSDTPEETDDGNHIRAKRRQCEAVAGNAQVFSA